MSLSWTGNTEISPKPRFKRLMSQNDVMKLSIVNMMG